MPSLDAIQPVHDRYHRRRKLSIAIAVASIVAATVYLFWPLFSGQATYFEWDVPEQYWPDLVYLCESLHGGELPYWNPYDRGGYPFHADPQAGTYHPLNWGICALGGPTPGLGWATARVVVGFLICGLFGLLWLRRLGASWAGAMVGAILLEAAPFMRHNWELNLTSGYAWLPMMLWAAERLATERRIPDGLLLALAWALCGWTGSPPALWLASSFTALYLVFRLGEVSREVGLSLVRGVPALATVALVGAALLGVMLVPGAELSEHSVQAGRSFESISQGSLEADQLFALLWPMPGNHLYVGLLAIALTPMALARAKSNLPWFFLIVFVVGAALAFGGAAFRVAYDWLPVFDVFRAPYRYQAWLGPCAAGLTALGLPSEKKAFEGALGGRLRVAGLCLIAIGIAALVLLEGLGPGLLAIALGILLASRTLRPPLHQGSILWAVLLGAIVLVDVTQALPDHRHMRPGQPRWDEPAAAAVFPHAPNTRERWRYMDEFAVGCRSGTRTRRRDFRGYQDPLLLASYERVVGSLREHPALAPQFNVRYALQGPHFIHGWDRHYLPPPDALRETLNARVVHRGEGERTVTELMDALPVAYFVPEGEVERASSRADALARTIALAPGAIAVLDEAESPEERPPHGRAAGGRPRAEARGLSLRPDRVAFTLDAPGRGVVVINEAWLPGWKARVDGRRVPIFRANGFVRAVPVDRGERRVVLTYRPRSGLYWRQVLLIGWLAILVGLLGLPLSHAIRRWARARAAKPGRAPPEG